MSSSSPIRSCGRRPSARSRRCHRGRRAGCEARVDVTRPTVDPAEGERAHLTGVRSRGAGFPTIAPADASCGEGRRRAGVVGPGRSGSETGHEDRRSAGRGDAEGRRLVLAFARLDRGDVRRRPGERADRGCGRGSSEGRRPERAARGETQAGLAAVPRRVPQLHADHPDRRSGRVAGRAGVGNRRAPPAADGPQRGDRAAPEGQGRERDERAQVDDEGHGAGPARRHGLRDPGRAGGGRRRRGHLGGRSGARGRAHHCRQRAADRRVGADR